MLIPGGGSGLVTKSYWTLYNPMDCSSPGSSVHGISQARILEGVAISSSRGSSQPRDQTCISCVSCIGRQVLYHRGTWESLLAEQGSAKRAFKPAKHSVKIIPWRWHLILPAREECQGGTIQEKKNVSLSGLQVLLIHVHTSLFYEAKGPVEHQRSMPSSKRFMIQEVWELTGVSAGWIRMDWKTPGTSLKSPMFP